MCARGAPSKANQISRQLSKLLPRQPLLKLGVMEGRPSIRGPVVTSGLTLGFSGCDAGWLPLRSSWPVFCQWLAQGLASERAPNLQMSRLSEGSWSMNMPDAVVSIS